MTTAKAEITQSMKQKMKQGRAQAQRAALPVGTVTDILALVREFPLDTVKELALPDAQAVDVKEGCQHEDTQATAANA